MGFNILLLGELAILFLGYKKLKPKIGKWAFVGCALVLTFFVLGIDFLVASIMAEEGMVGAGLVLFSLLFLGFGVFLVLLFLFAKVVSKILEKVGVKARSLG